MNYGYHRLLLHTTGDLELDREIEEKTIAGTLTGDEKAWIAMSNSLWEILGDLGWAIREEFGVDEVSQV